MARYYDFKDLKGEEIERLLLDLKKLITTEKITNYLPSNTTSELLRITNNISNILQNLSISNDINSSDITIDSGEY